MEQTASPESLGESFNNDSLGKSFTGSLAAHGIAVALFLTSGLWNIQHHFGEQHASTGSVGVDVVKSIPIPRPDAPENPVANDTKAIVPPAPAVRQVEKLKAPPPDAIPLSTNKPKKVSKQEEARMLFRPPVEYKSNQLYSRAAPAASSPMFGKQGSAGIDVGEASVLGERFGAYVDLMRDRIAQHWNQADVPHGAQRCEISFTIARNGSVTDVKIEQPSGSYVLDTSAKRAILDASPLPELPAQLSGNSVPVHLWFQVR
jgi:protein TonB